MIAKIFIFIAAFVAMFPHVESLRTRLIVGSIVIGGLSGLVGTAARPEGVGMIPINTIYAIMISMPIIITLHYFKKATATAMHTLSKVKLYYIVPML